MAELVVGADVGGTATRVGVADLGGRVLSRATGGPGNPHVVGLAESAAEIRATMEIALAPVRGTVTRVVLGLAGGSRAAGEPGFARAAMPPAVAVLPELVSDLSVAFCSGTPAANGYVLLAGTGSVAGEVREGQLVQQRNGWGWLLGDDGSGFWMGRQAVRVTLEALQRQPAAPELGPLQRAVLEAAGATNYLELLQACYAAPPTWLAQFAPLVSQYADRDHAAAEIVAEAVRHLEGLLSSLDPVGGRPLVLAGSVLTTPGPVNRTLRSRLGASVSSVYTSSSGVVGALWMALAPRVDGDPAVHRRLVSTAERAIAQIPTKLCDH